MGSLLRRTDPLQTNPSTNHRATHHCPHLKPDTQCCQLHVCAALGPGNHLREHVQKQTHSPTYTYTDTIISCILCPVYANLPLPHVGSTIPDPEGEAERKSPRVPMATTKPRWFLVPWDLNCYRMQLPVLMRQLPLEVSKTEDTLS